MFRKALLYRGGHLITKNRVIIPQTAKAPFNAINPQYAYPSKNNPGRNRETLNPIIIKTEQQAYLDVLGQMRYDTSFIRNILAIDTMHRLLRVKLSGEMTRITFPVVTGPPAVSMHITDENLWETYDDVQRAYN